VSTISAIQPCSFEHMRFPLQAGVVYGGRRFLLCLVSSHYRHSGVAIFTEVTADNSADGEPRHDVFQDVGTWCVDATDDGPSILKVDVMPADNLPIAEGVAVMNALIEQVGTAWSDTWERWQP
jgi:hypothetical protein